MIVPPPAAITTTPIATTGSPTARRPRWQKSGLPLTLDRSPVARAKPRLVSWSRTPVGAIDLPKFFVLRIDSANATVATTIVPSLPL